LRTAFQYTNSNFTELYTAVGPSGNNIVVPGTATITGNLTVDTSTLKVDSANDRVGIGTATPAAKLIVRDGTNRNLLVSSDATQLGSAGIAIGGFTDNAAGYAPMSLIASSMQFGIGGTTAMTLNSTGLGVGVVPSSYRFEVGSGSTDTRALFTSNNAFSIGVKNGANQLGGWIGSAGNNILTFSGNDGTMKVTIDNTGNVGVGVTTFGTSAARVLSIATGTEPTTGPTGTVQWFTSTRSANNTIPAIFTEGSGVTNAAITNVTVTNKIALKVNGTIYYLLATTSAA